jgi:membrane fusion protein, multidrug efflux system
MRRVTALALLLTTAACGKPSGGGGPPSGEMPPAPVVVAAAESADVPRYREEIGRCTARESVSLQPQVTGLVTTIHFQDGADVKKGDPLFTIDPRPFQAQLAAAEASLAQARASLELAKVDFARIRKLVEQKVAAQQEFDAARSAVDVAEARVLQMQANVDTARLNLEYCSLRSPIDGRTGHRLVDVGNTVKANETALVLIQRMDPIYADFSASEGELAEVRRYLSRGPLRVEVRMPDQAGEPGVGELTFVDNAVQQGTGTVMLRATLPNADRRFWPGLFVRVRLVLEVVKDAVLIPESAPQMAAKGTFVYVVKEDLSTDFRPVTLGQRHGNRVVVEKGVQAGERVVTQGHLGVFPGRKVKIETPTPAAETRR